MSIRDYKITDAQIAEKGVIASPDTLTGTADENKRVFDRLVRECVAPQFNAIVDEFADMEESTNSWSAEEAQRVQQENARQSAEQGRVSAEGQRETNETARLLSEENRISAETARVNAETARVNAENKRDSAEKSRVSAENARNVWQTYDAAKTYVPGNKVSFGGSSYVCTAATVGHAPTDTAYWLLIAQKGADGAGADDLQRINDALDAVDPIKITAKAEPADGDGVMIADSADGGRAKRLLWSSVKTALGKLFVPLARKINGKTLSKDVTLTGENIAVSTADSTPISGAVKYRTNPNLLDNWYFGNPVNQRGQTEYTGNATYSIDRWWTQYDTTLSIVDGGIKIGGRWDVQQYFENTLPNATYTLSLLYKDRTGSDPLRLLIGNRTDGDIAQTESKNASGILSVTFSTATSNKVNFGFAGSTDNSAIIIAIKLELGDTQTLAHKENEKWVLNEIPDFGEQLRRCQRYCVDVTPSLTFNSMYGGTLSSTGCDFLVPIPVTLRESGSVPAVICNPSEWQVAVVAANAYFTPTSIRVSQIASGAVSLRCLFSHSLSSQYCDLRKATDSAKLILSKDL